MIMIIIVIATVLHYTVEYPIQGPDGKGQARRLENVGENELVPPLHSSNTR